MNDFYEKYNNISSSDNNDNSVAEESSYEWNPGKSKDYKSGEYSYSYINGKNTDAPHNPNRYDRIYSTAGNSDASGSTDSSTAGVTPDSGYDINSDSCGNDNTVSNSSSSNPYYGGYSSSSPYSSAPSHNAEKKRTKKKVKKERKPASRAFVAALLVITVLSTGTLGFLGGMYFSKSDNTSSNSLSNGSININKVEADNTSSVSGKNLTSQIVEKSADSVVEIETEGIKTGTFARQYVVKGAGSGVIITTDGYIITNHHVIEGASSIKVTLRDGETSYEAKLVGSDKEQDIALLKVDQTGLHAATFGDSSKLNVGDYVVAIGNPLGKLGGTVTDGIISALAREVTIENNNMTLLQTNAQISPGNSGGGLFNSNGDLIGIVNAKDSATEVEGIAFAIPINNVLDIINDLKSYGYVTGKIDLGIQFIDVSEDSAQYYGVNYPGCYVQYVTRGSNAEAAGFQSGDLVKKVNGTDISDSSDISKALENSKVGDTVSFVIVRNGQSGTIQMELAQYNPNNDTSESDGYVPGSDVDDYLSEIFGW